MSETLEQKVDKHVKTIAHLWIRNLQGTGKTADTGYIICQPLPNRAKVK